jgi:hypothetical protein
MFRRRSVLRTRGVLTFSATAAAIVTVATVGQMAHSKRTDLHDPGYPPPYDNSKADQALRHFDINHRECELWSDWRKLCSRIGPNGSTYCQIDSSHPVKPSAPFCARQNGMPYFTDGDNLPRNESEQQRRSRFRFSEVTSDGNRVWIRDRPFYERSFRQRNIRSCKIYSYLREIDHSLQICSNKPIDKIGYCQHDLGDEKSYSKVYISCEKWANSWGNQGSPITRGESISGGEIQKVHAPNSFPFNGM